MASHVLLKDVPSYIESFFANFSRPIRSFKASQMPAPKEKRRHPEANLVFLMEDALEKVETGRGQEQPMTLD